MCLKLMAIYFSDGVQKKKMLENEIMLVTKIFSFFYAVFKGIFHSAVKIYNSEEEG